MRGRVDPAARHAPSPLNTILPDTQLAAGPRSSRRPGLRRGAALGAIVLVILLAAATYAFGQQAPGAASASQLGGETVQVQRFASGLDSPWGLAFLPDGKLLVTERGGRLRSVDAAGKIGAPLAGVPEVAARGQGGLLDVVLDPAFAQNRLIYLSYAEPRPEGAATAVARARLADDLSGLSDVKVIFRQQPAVSGGNHFGSRLVFAADGLLFITLGDRSGHSEKAQDLSSTIGKLVRIAPDGSTPPGNPFSGRSGARPEIYSYGHRNMQGAAIEPGTGRLWIVDHGARGGDEVNRPEPGKNYGWPVISYGRHYSGGKIGEGTAKDGMEQPLFYWDPSIAPSGAAFYSGDALPGWRGQLFVGGLAAQALVMVKVRDGTVTGEERLPLGKRVRDVRMGPDGALWLVAEDTGEILRVVPAGR